MRAIHAPRGRCCGFVTWTWSPRVVLFLCPLPCWCGVAPPPSHGPSPASLASGPGGVVLWAKDAHVSCGTPASPPSMMSGGDQQGAGPVGTASSPRPGCPEETAPQHLPCPGYFTCSHRAHATPSPSSAGPRLAYPGALGHIAFVFQEQFSGIYDCYFILKIMKERMILIFPSIHSISNMGSDVPDPLCQISAKFLLQLPD